MKPLAEAAPLGFSGLARVREAVPRLLAAQEVLLRHLCSRLGTDGVLDLFGVEVRA